MRMRAQRGDMKKFYVLKPNRHCNLRVTVLRDSMSAESSNESSTTASTNIVTTTSTVTTNNGSGEWVLPASRAAALVEAALARKAAESHKKLQRRRDVLMRWIDQVHKWILGIIMHHANKGNTRIELRAADIHRSCPIVNSDVEEKILAGEELSPADKLGLSAFPSSDEWCNGWNIKADSLQNVLVRKLQNDGFAVRVINPSSFSSLVITWPSRTQSK